MKSFWKRAAAGAMGAVMLLVLAACGAAEDVNRTLEEISALTAEIRTEAEEVSVLILTRRAEEAQRLADKAAAEEAAAAAEAARLAEEARLAAEEAAVKLIGERDESQTKITLYNKSGYDLNEFYIRVPDEGWTDNLIGDVYEIGEKRYLFYDAEGEGYDLWINMVGDWHYTLHDFPFGDIEAGDLCYDYDADVMYVEYTSLATQETVSTLASETAIHEAELEAARQAEAAAAAAAAAAAQSSGNSDTCLTDGLFW